MRATRDALAVEGEAVVRPGLASELMLRATEAAVSLEVEVVDRSGAPLAAWEVRVFGGRLFETSTTGGDGIARFTVRPDRRYELAVLRRGSTAARRADVDPAAGRVRVTVDLTATAPGGARGRVVGDGVVAGNMLLVPEGGGGQNEARLGEDGSFQFREVTAGPYWLYLQSEARVAEKQRVAVPPGGAAEVGDVLKNRAVVRFTVAASGAETVVDVTVR